MLVSSHSGHPPQPQLSSLGWTCTGPGRTVPPPHCVASVSVCMCVKEITMCIKHMYAILAMYVHVLVSPHILNLTFHVCTLGCMYRMF